MGSQYEIYFIVIQESLDSIWSKLNDISGTIGVPHKIWLNAQFTIAVRRITPENINDQLLLDRANLMNDFQRPSDLFNLFKAYQSTPNPTMQAYYPILDHRCQRQPIEEVIDLIEYGVMVRWVLAESIAAFFSKAKSIIDHPVFVIASQQMNFVRKSNFQSH